MYEEGCRILSEMEVRGEEVEEGEEEEEEERYLFELCLLHVRGEQKNLKEDEVSRLRREVEELRTQVEEEKKKREEAEKGKEEEKRKREEIEKRLEEEMKKREQNTQLEQPVAELQPESNKPASAPPPPSLLQVITSLDGISAKFSNSGKIKRVGNRIIHDTNSWDLRHCFIGGEMQSVCV